MIICIQVVFYYWQTLEQEKKRNLFSFNCGELTTAKTFFGDWLLSTQSVLFCLVSIVVFCHWFFSKAAETNRSVTTRPNSASHAHKRKLTSFYVESNYGVLSTSQAISRNRNQLNGNFRFSLYSLGTKTLL